MKLYFRSILTRIFFVLLTGFYTNAALANSGCSDHNADKNVYYGDLHVHTSMSADAAIFDVTNRPADAYRFAKGEAISLPVDPRSDLPLRSAQLDRPLDFVGVSDHAEFLGRTELCLSDRYKDTPKGRWLDILSDQDTWGRRSFDGLTCSAIRNEFIPGFGVFQANGFPFADILGGIIGFALSPSALGILGQAVRNQDCGGLFQQYDGPTQFCQNLKADMWQETQSAAAEANEPCEFTSFVGYEWSGTPGYDNQHRNVFFRNDVVTALPISYIEARDGLALRNMLDEQCTDLNNGCEVLTIPHNSNLGGGEMYRTEETPTVALASQRQRLEPIMEIHQHKGASECSLAGTGNLPFMSNDEECAFESVIPPDEICQGDEPFFGPNGQRNCTPLCEDLAQANIPILNILKGGGLTGSCITPSDFARPALRRGLEQEHELGVNPYKFGFIGSTDSHNANPGDTEEEEWQGHVGFQDSTTRRILSNNIVGDTSVLGALVSPFAGAVVGVGNLLAYNPGGLAAVWSEENTRDSLFDAMQRKEVYATSGNRIKLRTFTGENIPANVCGSTSDDFITLAKNSGAVPMGGDVISTGAPIKVAVDAKHDAQAPAGLNRVQIIKGWVDSSGNSHEKVFTVGGSAINNNDADLRQSCVPQKRGYDRLCRVWTDPEFNSSQNAFYYARVIENKTCRWSESLCQNYDSTTNDSNLVQADVRRECDKLKEDGVTIIEERAWSSPVWVEADL